MSEAETEKGWSMETLWKGEGKSEKERGKGEEREREKEADEGPWAINGRCSYPGTSSSEQPSQTGLPLAQGAGLLGQLE